jgi:hypothetical protein
VANGRNGISNGISVTTFDFDVCETYDFLDDNPLIEVTQYPLRTILTLLPGTGDSFPSLQSSKLRCQCKSSWSQSVHVSSRARAVLGTLSKGPNFRMSMRHLSTIDSTDQRATEAPYHWWNDAVSRRDFSTPFSEPHRD